jgi:hypothetical protein
LKSDGHSANHLLQWEVTGSIDKITWVVIDTQNTQELNGNWITKIFSCPDNPSGPRFYRYIRLTQTGKESSGNYYLLLGNIEFFGSMSNGFLNITV